MYKRLILILLSSSTLVFLSNYRSVSKISNNAIDNFFFWKTSRNYSRNICESLQAKISYLLNNKYSNVSISVIDSNNNLIIDLNGDTLRIPASNQKLISTSYSLNKLGPHYRFKTILFGRGKNNYILIGSGDPDLNIAHLKQLSKSILLDQKPFVSRHIKINLYEENKDKWWPTNWSMIDRTETYGAPITRLALTSNYSSDSLKYPTRTFTNKLVNQLDKLHINHSLETHEYNSQKPPITDRIVSQIESAPLYSFLSLANSESHNFTAEVMLKNALNDWDPININDPLTSWLKRNGISSENYNLVDASGLSRKNKVTTNGLALLLKQMYIHKYAKYYFSSLSVYGIRGTLSDAKYDANLNGIFHGKTGTLDNIRTLSGLLKRRNNPLIISIIANNINNSSTLVTDMLSLIAQEDSCS